LAERLLLGRITRSDRVGAVFCVFSYNLEAGVDHCLDGLIFLLTLGILATTNTSGFGLMLAVFFPFILQKQDLVIEGLLIITNPAFILARHTQRQFLLVGGRW
jgi:hypothetical protein